MGQFGATSSERVYTASTAYTSYTYANGVAAAAPTVITYKKPPAPSPWCHYLVNHLDVSSWFHAPFFQTAGANYGWIIQGVGEAIERFSYHNSYEWLVLAPIVTRHHHTPETYDNSAFETSIQDYLSVSQKVIGAAEAQAALAVAQRAAQLEARAEAVGLAAIEPPDPPAAQLARAFAAAVVTHAPSITVLNLLLAGGAPLAHLVETDPGLEPTFASKIGDRPWKDLSSLSDMGDLLATAPSLRTPGVAAALLGSKTSKAFADQIISLVATCIADGGPGNASPAGATAGGGSGGLSAAGGQDAPMGSNELVGDWALLNNNAKEWLRRLHEAEPEAIKKSNGEDDDEYGSWGTGWWTKGKSKTKKKTPPLTALEVAALRADALSLCCAHVDALLTSGGFFMRNPRGVLFEMSRCWFLKGSGAVVLEAICSLATQGGGLESYRAPLATYVAEEAIKLARGSSHTMAEVERLLMVVREKLPPAMPLAHDLLYSLAVDATWPMDEGRGAADREPSLDSCLSNADMWSAVLRWCLDGGVLKMDTRLVRLLGTVKAVLAAVAEATLADAVELKNLSSILGGGSRSARSFLKLVADFDVANSGAVATKIEELQARKEAFDARLACASTFGSFFCASAGVPIDSAALRRLVDEVTRNYSNILSKDIVVKKPEVFVFGGLSAAAGPVGVLDSVPLAIDWLYKLRSSELFLGLWRAIAQDVVKESVPGAVELLAREGAAAEEEDGESEEEEEVRPPLPEGLAGDEDAIRAWMQQQEGTLQARAQEREAARLAKQQAIFDRQDREKRIKEELETKVLSQDQVVSLLLPRAQARWQELAMKAAMGSLSIQSLDETFARIPAAQVKDEIRALFATTQNHGALGVSWDAEGTASKMEDYFLLRRLAKWLPSLLNVHSHLKDLCTAPLEEDELRAKLSAAHDEVQQNINLQTLGSIPTLVRGIRGVFSSFSPEQLDLLSTLGESPALVEWLLAHSDQQEFNQMLNVVRPCTDEPRMLSAIASLVFIRTLLLEPLYSNPPYGNLLGLMGAFGAIKLSERSDADGDPLWHLTNIVGTFDALADVFEKQTKSPSIKSCYDLRDLVRGGSFVLKLGVGMEKALVVAQADGSEVDMEYLLDLRSKLLMAEVPQELEDEFQASLLIEEFVQQLQTMSDTVAVLSTLYGAGHSAYQVSYEHRRKINLGGLGEMQDELKMLQVKSGEWTAKVEAARSKFFFLNYLSMRDVLRVRELVTTSPSEEGAAAEVPEGAVEVPEEPAAGAAEAAPPAEVDPNIEMVVSMGFPADHAFSALRRCGQNVEQAIEFLFSHSQHMDRLVAEDAQLTGSGVGEGRAPVSFQVAPAAIVPISPLEEFVSLLHAISSTVSQEEVGACMEDLRERLRRDEEVLVALGQVLGCLNLSLFSLCCHAWSVGLHLCCSKQVLETLFGATPGEALARVPVRDIPVPGADASNRSDMLITIDSVEEGKKGLPIFVAASETPEQVIDVVLSVYVRRGRLPEPGEVLFATGHTSLEEVYHEKNNA